MNYDGHILCAVPNSIGDESCLWPFVDVEVYAEGMLGEISIEEAVDQALSGWNAVCGIRLRRSVNSKTAHIVVTRALLDGAGRVLADSELPCGFTKTRWRQLRQRYDTGEIWTISENPPANRIDAVRVVCHEIGHAIGIPHIDAGNLMAAMYSNAIRWPQRGDIKEAVLRYGKPTQDSPKPTPQPNPSPQPSPIPGVGVSRWEKFLFVTAIWPKLTREKMDAISKLMQE